MHFLMDSCLSIHIIEKLQEICSKYGAVAYIDIKDGESEVRVHSINIAAVTSNACACTTGFHPLCQVRMRGESGEC